MVPLEASPESSPVSSNLPTPTSEQYLGNATQTSSQAELAIYHHQAMGSPPKSIFLTTIQKHPPVFGTFPGLTYGLINKHLPLSTATLKVHMVQNR
jgi:hypothetical protein